MSEPRFLTVPQVERLHEKLINLFGGSKGLRERNVFEGAVFQPRNTYYYAQGDLFDIAAAYAFHITEAQAFLDGNKRTGIAAALAFLEGNGIEVPANTDELFEAMAAIAEKRMSKAECAALFRRMAADARQT